MKKIFSLLNLFIITFMFFGMINVNAENVYKSYKVGEEITAQVDKAGHKGTFIVIGDSPTTSDEVVVIQKNGGLDSVIKDFNISYNYQYTFEEETEKFPVTMETFKVPLVVVNAALTFGQGPVDSILDQIPSKFNGYIRTEKDEIFGMMTVDKANSFTKEQKEKIFKGQNYWLSAGASDESVPQHTGNDFTFDVTNNKLIVNDEYTDENKTENISYVFNKYARIENGVVSLDTILPEDLFIYEYEPAVMFTLCKTAIVVPNTNNPKTSDMDVLMLSIVGLLTLGVVVLSTKKILAIK